MSFVDPRKPPHLIGDNWRDLARAANVECDVLIPESPIDPRPDLASSPEHPDRTDDPEFPYSRPVEEVMPNSDVARSEQPESASAPHQSRDNALPQSSEAGAPLVPMPISEASKEIAEINTTIETQRAEVEAVMAGRPLEHSPVIPIALRRERTLSDYYGVFGPPRKR
jgi:hypothetical protein